MKVTNEMVERALDYLDGQVSPGRVLKTLEAVLADVDEPNVVDTLRNLLAVQRQRTAEAEAKLAELEDLVMGWDGWPGYDEALGIIRRRV